MQRVIRFTLRGATLCILAALGGCNPSDFDEYEKTAPIRAYDSPQNRRPGFGRVLSALQIGSNTPTAKSLVVASAGRDAPIVFERIWNGTKLGNEAVARCKRADDCKEASGIGGTLIPFGKWARGTAQEEDGCVYAPAVPKAYVFCDSNVNSNQSFTLELGAAYPPDMSTVYFSGASLPEGHALGIAILGSYAVHSRSLVATGGRLFYQPDYRPAGGPSVDDVVPRIEPLPLLDPRSREPFASDPEPGSLGYAIAIDSRQDGVQIIAIAQPSHGRVIVASYDERLSGELADKLQTRACITSPDPELPGFGKRLALGDINADGAPELFIGIDPIEHPNALGRVWMYRSATMPAPEAARDACPLWPEPIQVGCYDGIRGVPCAGSAFGASLALGDVDADGYRDLIAGAPYAAVQGGTRAGAVWVIPGGPDSAESGGLAFDRMTSLFATKKANANLGMAVTTLHTRGRDEPVAGAPGEDQLFVFMCTKLEIGQNEKNLCLPQ